MHPNVPENQPAQVVALPPASNLPQGGLPVTVTSNSFSGGSGAGAPQRAAEQVKQLAEQYGRDPFKFSGTFGRLKEQHLQEQYHIVPSSIKE